MAILAFLVQFILRLSLGMSLGMAVTSPATVTSGYFRNHLYVLLGLNVLAALVAFSAVGPHAAWLAVAAAGLSYIGSICWLYEKPRAGIVFLAAVSVASLVGAHIALGVPNVSTGAADIVRLLDPLTGGLILGLPMAAMFLGHWYLNTPSMQLGPLRKLLVLIAVAVGLRAAVCGAALALYWSGPSAPDQRVMLLLAWRWLAGLLAVAVLVWMTWQTLKIPNTQSATGILYVVVIATFLGELASQLLSSEPGGPL